MDKSLTRNEWTLGILYSDNSYSDQCSDCLLRECSSNMSFFFLSAISPTPAFDLSQKIFKKRALKVSQSISLNEIYGSEEESLPKSHFKFHTGSPSSLASYVCLTLSLFTSSGGDRAKHTLSQSTALICVMEHMRVCIVTPICLFAYKHSISAE